ncbi:sulfotransferase [Aliiglaciecola sp. 3_MG-2023]|uniref:tetratricopeptide repeat-containing sulfotransferase family protein n=1 Tax=Aliiglaciecola sp. 3_MG-2023 TaxID=3062644 RepID=UPI0026E181B5|nr:sulfotransferase [Aliiglaciecola sp. 3_MG-2023]MDO6694187.1 sulfotransferase [Aliiglaciecola sp. 3_MG-2023]
MLTEQSQNAQKKLDGIWLQIRNKQLEIALAQCKSLCADFPEYAPAWHTYSEVNLFLGKHALALRYIEAALALSPNIPDWLLLEAKLHFILGDRRSAQDIASSLTAEDNDSVVFNAELALLLNKLNLYQPSLTHYQRALTLQPDNPQILFNLASVQRYVGKLDSAKSTLDKLIALNPNDSEAWLMRSNLHKQTSESNHVDKIKTALTRPASPISKSQLYYALGKELEDLAEYGDAFNAFQQGASIRRQHMQYSLDNDLASLDQIRNVFDANTVHNDQPGYDSQQPIFIVGLPRTGSTLVERIVSSHSQVMSAGELNNFALQMMQQIQQSGVAKPVNKLDLISLTKQIDFKRLGQSYIESTYPDTQGHRKFIDKLPLNSLYVGLIHLALPNAKIIHVERNPLDTCYAIFKHIFTQGYPFSYNLDELAQYQIAHHKLMTHWKTLLPNKIHSISYENLTSNIEAQTNAILDYCELPIEQQCHNFQDNIAASTTASAAQIRQPVYSSSVNKWKHVSKQLSSVHAKFELAGLV